jgi:hypothetical protein
VVVGRDRASPALEERPVGRSDHLDDPVSLAVEARGRGRREHRVALELDQGETGLDALDDRVQQRPQDAVGSGDPAAEIDPMLLFHAGHEARVARDVRE